MEIFRADGGIGLGSKRQFRVEIVIEYLYFRNFDRILRGFQNSLLKENLFHQRTEMGFNSTQKNFLM